ncbi:DNA recombination protein RmuC [Sulfurimonas sp.]|uniref:DNA recombination protein RmuC n=1 Tax=Sulfurimonas sp. TaxID=2022749 RepID=UPI00262770A5|nr:DNA recombination protein RmuC [Sulfurimonas sp.]
MDLNLLLIAGALLLVILLVFVILYVKELSVNKILIKKVQEFKELEQEYKSLEIDYAVLNTRYENEMYYSKEKIETLKRTKEELSLEFKMLSNKIFDEKSKEFGALNKEQIELLLAPFREQVANFSKQSRQQFEVDIKERFLLKDELLRLQKMNEQLSQEALNLTKALKSENKMQGNWGELVLENILEQSGLRKGVEYELQATLKSDENRTYRPDVIIHMPQNRDIIVDSKVSLVAYERFVNAEDEAAKKRALREHIASISAHIKELSNKEYEKLQGVNTLDFVLLFMPIEGAFLLALEEDGEFFKHAYESQILVVSPSTLLVTLRTIEHIWRTQRQEEHAQKIAKEAEAMYDKLVLFVEEMQNIEAHLNKAHDAYDKAMNRLSSGKGNVIKRAQTMKELGLKPKKELSLKSEKF